MIKILYLINSDWSFGLAASSIIISLVLANCSDKKKNKIIIVSICGLILTLITVNYYFMKNYVKLPYYVGCQYGDVKIRLSDMRIKNIRPVVQDGSEVRNDCIVESCDCFGKIVNRNDEIIIILRSEKPINDNTIIENSDLFRNKVSIKESIGSDIFTITSVKSFDNGEFYYENAVENYIVEFEQGISGTFSYNRSLTEAELDDWGHGGKLLDSAGSECYSTECSFFSTNAGVFAVKLPSHIKSGKYTYILYQVINGEYYEAKIYFEII